MKISLVKVSPYKAAISSKINAKVSLLVNSPTAFLVASTRSATLFHPSKCVLPKVPACINATTSAIALILPACFSNLETLTNTLAIEYTTSSKSNSGIALKISLVKVSPYMLAISSKIILGVSPNVKCITIS